MKLDFYDFRELYKNMREVDKESNSLPPLINIKEFESWFSCIVSLIIVVILAVMVNTNISNISSIVTITQNMLLYIISGLIAMLGFIVAGLAIMLSTTSNIVLTIVIEENKIKYLLSVFASFVYIAVVMIGLIIACVIFYFILGINYPFTFWFYLLCGFIISYLFFFVLFYIVSLLGTCINIFIFNYSVYEERKNLREEK